jgi:signal transduction histidine kinase
MIRLNQWMGLGFAAALCLLTTIAFISYRSTTDFAASAKLVSHTHKVIGELDAIYASLKDGETAERGYLITGDEGFLQTYHNTVLEIPKHFALLISLTSDNPPQQKNIVSLEAIVTRRLLDLQSAIAAYRRTGRSEDTQIISYIQNSKLINNQIRNLVSTIESIENDLLKTRAQTEESNFESTKQWIMLGSIVSIVFLTILFYLMYRQSELRKNAQLETDKLNHQLSDYATQLEGTNKELESFSYSVSHDLRSPLRAIDGFSRILQEDYANKLDQEGLRLLGIIRDNTKNMGQLISDLLEFSRYSRHPVKLEQIDMNSMVEDVWTSIKSSNENIPIPLNIGTLPSAWGDRALLKQIWLNLLSNALKYSGKSDQPLIQVTGKTIDDELVYEVKDNGAGFDMRYYSKLFGVFQRLHSAADFPGTGVGLAIAHRIVTRHGGRIWATSEINAGSIFSFSLPKQGEPT